jgi:protein-S-isoprenylcysteine O-methyltransferase Ste14
MILLICTIALWGLLHSLAASIGFKDFIRRVFGDGFMKFYRLFYNIFAVISIAPILYLMFSLPDITLYQVPAPWTYFLLVGQVLSLVLILVVIWQTDLLSFAGLRQLMEAEKPRNLVISGFYRSVRHPLYLFILLFLWLTPLMTTNLLVVYLALTIYILIGTVFEERKLLREFGQEYTDYKSSTPMLIPGLPKAVVQRRAPAGTSHGNK